MNSAAAEVFDEEAAITRRAACLLRWYPKAWRSRYGDEFTELLIADIHERPSSLGRTADVIRGGIVARLSQAGLAGTPLVASKACADVNDSAKAEAAARYVTASLVSLGCALAVFLAFGAAMWSQLAIGWQWQTSATQAITAPAIPASATVATIVTSMAMLAFLVLGGIAALPVLAAVGTAIAKTRDKRLILTAAMLTVAVTALFIGGRHFGNGWPGTGGHHGLLPSGIAAFEWAVTLSVSSYWAHPSVLAAFPAPEVAWMAASPLILAIAVASTAVLVRRVGIPARATRFEARLGAIACVVMAVFIAACCCWVANGGQRGMVHAGLIDVAGLAVMALAFAVARQAARKARLGLTFGSM